MSTRYSVHATVINNVKNKYTFKTDRNNSGNDHQQQQKQQLQRQNYTRYEVNANKAVNQNTHAHFKREKNSCTRSLDGAKTKRITNKTAKCNVFLTYAELRTDSNIKKRECEKEREMEKQQQTIRINMNLL